jgi:hypothetical protein
MMIGRIINNDEDQKKMVAQIEGVSDPGKGKFATKPLDPPV